jgi:Zinc carboxypeptidase
MRRRISAIVAVGVLVSGLGATTAGATPSAPGTSTAAAQEQGEGVYDVYVGKIDARDLAAVRATGLDPHEMDITATPDGQAEVEVVLSEDEATELADQGVDLELKQIDGQSAAEASTLQAAQGFEVYRTYGGAGGIKEEFEQIAADNPDIVKLVTIGQSVNGQDIIAIKVTNRANQVRDGQRPATLYSSTQHAREWITPEMNRRLAHHVVDNTASTRRSPTW